MFKFSTAAAAVTNRYRLHSAGRSHSHVWLHQPAEKVRCSRGDGGSSCFMHRRHHSSCTGPGCGSGQCICNSMGEWQQPCAHSGQHAGGELHSSSQNCSLACQSAQLHTAQSLVSSMNHRARSSSTSPCGLFGSTAWQADHSTWRTA